MDKRKSERVQFFQLPFNHDLIPVWVFHLANPDSVLGLLLDISADGVQIFTDKASPLQDDAYQLIVHSDEVASSSFISVRVHRLWSKPDGTLYIRSGFVFDGGEASLPSIKDVLAARDAGKQWLRCELTVV
jgi:hypothetical protein